MTGTRIGASILKTKHKIGVYEKLKKVVEKNGNSHRYKEGYSDHRVAEEYGNGVTRWNVQFIRKEMFGNWITNNRGEDIDNEELIKMRRELDHLKRWAEACGYNEEEEVNRGEP